MKFATGLQLTERESQCLSLCAAGKSYWESGMILGISERTVSFHMEAVRAKLGATTNAHAVAIAWGDVGRSRLRRPELTSPQGAESLPAASSHKG